MEASEAPLKPPPKPFLDGGKAFESAGKSLEKRSIGGVPIGGMKPRTLVGAGLGIGGAVLGASGIGTPIGLGMLGGAGSFLAGSDEPDPNGLASSAMLGGAGAGFLDELAPLAAPMLGKASQKLGPLIAPNDTAVANAGQRLLTPPPPAAAGGVAHTPPMSPPPTPRLPPERPVTAGVGPQDDFESYIAENAMQPPAGRRVPEAMPANGRPKTVTSDADMQRWSQWASDPANAQGAGLTNPPSLLDDFAMGRPPVERQPPLGNPKLQAPDANYIWKQGAAEGQMPPNFNDFPGALKTEAQKAGGINGLLAPSARFPEGVPRGGSASAGKNVQSPRFPTQTTDDDLARHIDWLRNEASPLTPPPRAETMSMKAPAAPPPAPPGPEPSISMTRPGTNAGGSPGLVTSPQAGAPSSSVPQLQPPLQAPPPGAADQFKQLLARSRTDLDAAGILGLAAIALGMGGAAGYSVLGRRGNAADIPNVPLTPPTTPYATQRPAAPEALIR